MPAITITIIVNIATPDINPIISTLSICLELLRLGTDTACVDVLTPRSGTVDIGVGILGSRSGTADVSGGVPDGDRPEPPTVYSTVYVKYSETVDVRTVCWVSWPVWGASLALVSIGLLPAKTLN